jgi:hypothetical protein
MEDSKRSKKNLNLTLIDFTDAYGSVNHTRLFELMELLNIPSTVTNHFKELYEDHNVVIKTGFEMTPKIAVLHRVP